jgi:hypothetical protein
MLNSVVLEIAMGVVLSYLLVALALTSAAEGVEAFRKTRARDLEIAIGELLDDKTPASRDRAGKIQNGLRVQLYLHPLVQALYRCSYEGGYFDRPKWFERFTPGGFARFFRMWRVGRRLPAYIQRDTFVLALIDLMGTDNGTSKGASEAFRHAWQVLDTATDGNPALMRAEIERWYEAVMDRASSRYKRRTQFKLFLAGLALAVTLNINSVVIAKVLRSGAPADRERTLAAARTLIDARKPTPSPTSTPDNRNAIAAVSTAGNVTLTPCPRVPIPGEVCKQTGKAGAAAGGDSNTSKGLGGSGDDKTNDLDRLTQEALRDALERAELPIGWEGSARCTTLQLAAPARFADECIKAKPSDKRKVSIDAAAEQKPEGCPCLAWLKLPPLHLALNWLLLGAGYLATALAAMLGAPFWFDILNRLVNVRSAIKPPAKAA